MYFCPNCNNVFDITKNSTQSGGADKTETIRQLDEKENKFYEEIIRSILDGKQISEKTVNEILISDLIKSQEYKKLKTKQKELIFNKIHDLLPLDKKHSFGEKINADSNKAYFICKNCGYKKQIDDGTLIFNKVSADVAQSYVASDVADMTHSDILYRTRKYICPKTDCESHKNPLKREAIFFRLNNTFKMKYICQTCKTSF